VIIGTQRLSKNFGRIQALDGVSLEIREGATGLLGPNGSGKTTLLRILLGLLPADGSATVLGLDPAMDPLEVRARIGYMPESECIIPGLAGVDVVAYLGRLAGLGRRPALKRAHEVMYYVGLDEQRYRDATEYSQGMQQRLKLATALVHDPDLIFLDEPTNGLDPDGRTEMLKIVGELATEHGKNLVFSSHLLKDVEKVCSHVVMLRKGKVVQTGEISELTSDHTGAYAVGIAGEREGYAAALAGAGATTTVGANGTLLVALPAGEGTRFLFRVARECGTHIRSLAATRRSLEDVFVAEMEDMRER
jgi:ABC-2 type transport system ATP-binding protein